MTTANRRTAAAGLACAALLFAAGSIARAEVRPPADAAAAAAARADAEAEAHVRRGRALILEGRHDDAYRELEEAHRLTARPALLFEMGECARTGGAVERARQAYALYLVEDPDGEQAAAARARLGELAGPTPPTTPAPPATAAPVPPPPAPSTQAALPSLTAARPAEAREPSPSVGHWPLWVAVGAAAALAIVAGTAYALSRDGGETCGKGCYDLR